MQMLRYCALDVVKMLTSFANNGTAQQQNIIWRIECGMHQPRSHPTWTTQKFFVSVEHCNFQINTWFEA